MANSFVASQGIVSTGGDGIGYATGAGSTAIQATSKATTVVLNNICGQITMNGAILNAGVIVSFTLTNSKIALGDTILINHLSGGTVGSYTFNGASAAGSATIYCRNATAGNLTETPVILFTVIKSVTA